MLMAHVWLQQQKQIYRFLNVRAGYVLYRALVYETVTEVYAVASDKQTSIST